MNRDFSHEYSHRHYVNTAHADRAEAIARFGFLVIAGADRGLRRSVEAIGTGVSSLVSRWQQYQARSSTYRALAKLDDRLLRDIGLTRADVELGSGELSVLTEETAPTPTARPTAAIYDLKRAA